MHTATQRVSPTELIHQDMVAGRLEEAKRGARAILKLRPHDPVASYLLGLIITTERGGWTKRSFISARPPSCPNAQRDCRASTGGCCAILESTQRALSSSAAPHRPI